jgi:leucyl-tRNA synthetase
MSERAARGLSCQAYDAANDVYFTREFGKIDKWETFSGDELLGLPLSAPHSTYEKVYTLPLLTISMGKGTGVVTSVPSNSPNNYVALKALKEQAGLCGQVRDHTQYGRSLRGRPHNLH